MRPARVNINGGGACLHGDANDLARDKNFGAKLRMNSPKLGGGGVEHRKHFGLCQLMHYGVFCIFCIFGLFVFCMFFLNFWLFNCWYCWRFSGLIDFLIRGVLG